MKIRILFVMAVAGHMLLMAGCSGIRPISVEPTYSNDAQIASRTLANFFDLMNAKQYEEAVQLYGGAYDELRNNNPDVNPQDFAGLLRDACEINGYQCLRAKSVDLQAGSGAVEFVFQVQFETTNGNLFVRGPCCGASATDEPPQSDFRYTVKKTAEGQFLVQELPPYVP